MGIGVKQCDEHNGLIIYDSVIYLECPLCRVVGYDELKEDFEALVEENDELKNASVRVESELEEITIQLDKIRDTLLCAGD